jgi:hypothetical protein
MDYFLVSFYIIKKTLSGKEVRCSPCKIKRKKQHYFPRLYLWKQCLEVHLSQFFIILEQDGPTIHILSGKSHANLKGQCHEIFCYWFFSSTSFPQASDYTIRAVSNFFENSRKYSQLKICHRCQRHRWQMEKTFKLKIFDNFVWTPLGSRVNIYINFCLQVHFNVSAA